jgi:hypothetical protein
MLKLMVLIPTKQTYERRIILLYFADKTLQHQLPLSDGHDIDYQLLSFKKMAFNAVPAFRRLIIYIKGDRRVRLKIAPQILVKSSSLNPQITFSIY